MKINYPKWIKENGHISSLWCYSMDTSIYYFINSWIPEHVNPKNNIAKLNLNPDFQRKYKWNIGQKQSYMQFLLCGGLITPFYFNQQGFLSNIKKNNYDDFVLVDGKQRIDAIIRYLNNEFPILSGQYFNDFDDKIRNSINIKIKINNLETKKDVLTWYLEINDTGLPHTKSEINRVKEMLEKEL